MFKTIFIIITIAISYSNLSHASDIYIPAIPVSEYKTALRDGNNVVFRNTKLPSSLKNIAVKTFGSHIAKESNKDQTVSPHIILGTNATRGEYPEYTLLLVEDSGSLFPICGATLIDSRKILTAAHCSTLPNNYYFIPNFYAFSDFPSDISDIPSSQLFPASSKRLHPNYTSTRTRLDHDIAIFTLTKSASTKKAVLYDNPESLAGAGGTVIGTGLLNSTTQATPNILQKVSAPIVSNSACQSAWGPGVQITSTVICAGFRNSDKGSCNGDSGGPLWTTVNGKRVQAGIVSFGPESCSDNSEVYSGYSRVSALANFVKQYAPNAVFSSDNAIALPPIYQLLLE